MFAQFLGGLIPGFLFSIVGGMILGKICFAHCDQFYTTNARRKMQVRATFGCFAAYTVTLAFMFIIGG